MNLEDEKEVEEEDVKEYMNDCSSRYCSASRAMVHVCNVLRNVPNLPIQIHMHAFCRLCLQLPLVTKLVNRLELLSGPITTMFCSFLLLFSSSFKGKQGNKPKKERLLINKWVLNSQPPAFKGVALPTEPPRQPSWLGSNHTSYARQRV